ncbi:MAG TPA: ABC transporter substrate-binding protein [Candidatus Limnocylindrales bacterium]|jgi:NitT/TauT family transport system substrate-binding protein|nr:ABC transporter substrate-binding protein [Candidatus Limnocylindrales bacterium]
MIESRRLRLTLALAAGLAVAACSSGTGGTPSAAPSEAPTTSAEASTPAEASPSAPVEVVKVDFRLNWVIAGNHAPFYLAQQKGFWTECGLDVSMAAGKGSGDTAQLVANGSQPFGLTDAVSIAAGRGKGLPVKSLGVLYQTNPASIVSYKATGITTLDDVKGKTWGAVPGGSPFLLLKGLFKAQGIGDDDYREVSVPAPGIAQLKAKQVDFITFFGNEAANIDPDPAANLNVLPFKDFGQDIYGLAIASSDDYIAAHPDQAACFVDGVRKGLEAAKADPDAALAALYAAAPETKDRPDVMRTLLDGVYEYAGATYLEQTAEKWDATQTVLVDSGIIDAAVPTADLFTNDYQ